MKTPAWFIQLTVPKTMHSGPALGIRTVGPKKIFFEIDPGAVS